MSEELTSKYKRGGKIVGQKLGEFEYFQIGATTFKQLLKAKIVPGSFNNGFIKNKPDRLIVDRRGREPKVIAVVEDKDSGKFASDMELIDAIRQCNNYCQEIGAIMGIITDGSTTVWINPNEKNKDNEYTDEVIKKKRSFSYIKNDDGSNVKRDFVIAEKQDLPDPDKMGDDSRKVFKLVLEVYQKINSKNSIIKVPETINPLPLAKRVWQDIWVATGKSPEKCLYNVVELFIFKFLSDLKLLQEPDSFEYLFSLIEKKRSNKDVLAHYAKICRPKIRELFPPSKEDGTTIINGTIFVNEDGEPNVQQAYLFVNSLKKFKDFEKEQGTFEYIDKDFKTKIFEAFLKQSEGQKALGQYFTPRKVVQAVVRMSGIENLRQGARFCDPFCGVGGFVLEPINLFRINDFEPKSGKIVSPITYLGYDKGFEKDDERTIILAKANMLIYLTEIISKNPSLSKVFADTFNSVFRLWQSNLGTLENIFDNEDDKFDLIMTNPPYVTSGSSSIKKEIAENTDLNSFYSINSAGVEGLALEWIIKNLKKGGKAFVVIPDGILNRLNDKKMRKYILDSCYLESIISLPIKTFFSTPKKTYILGITKKDKPEDVQKFPVFTYLVSNIGESLDVNRFEIPDNDLEEAVKLFRIFQVNKNARDIAKDFKEYKRCKIVPIKDFDPDKSWAVDRWWSKDEKISLGIIEKEEILTIKEYFSLVNATISEISAITNKESKAIKVNNVNFAEVSLDKIIDFSQKTNSSKFTKSFIDSHKGPIPVYSASDDVNFVNYGFVADNLPSVKYFEDCMTWNIDGSVGRVFIRNGRFSLSEKVIPLIVFPEYRDLLDMTYLKYEIEKEAKKKDFGFTNKAGKSKLKELILKIPVDKKGNYSLSKQQEIAKKYEEIEAYKITIINKFEKLATQIISFD